MRIKLPGLFLLLPSLAFGQISVSQPGQPVALGSGVVFRIPDYDPDANSYFARAGITDQTIKRKISDFVKTVKANVAWADVCILLCKSAQNAGTGNTVYSLGGWTTNNMTLVNGGTWSPSGIAFNGSTQYGTITLPGFQSLSDLLCLARLVPTSASGVDSGHGVVLAYGNTGSAGGGFPADRSWYVGGTTILLNGESVSIGVTNSAGYSRAAPAAASFAWGAGEDFTEVWLTSATVSASTSWKNSTSAAITLTTGTQTFGPQNAEFSTNNLLILAGQRLNGSISGSFAGTLVAVALVKSNLSQSAREALVNAVNGL